MAPECFYAIRSAQTDIWAVGVMFHLLLTGNLPFSQPDQISVMNAILNAEPQIQAHIPAKLKQIISKALDKNPTQRYQSALEMRMDLSNFSSNFYTETEKIFIQPNFDTEEETLVSSRLPQPQIQPIKSTFSNLRKVTAITLILLSILAVTTIWATFQFGKKEDANSVKQTNSTTQLPTDANGSPVQPLDAATGLNEQGLSNTQTLMPEVVGNSNKIKLPSNTLPGGDGYDPWARGGVPPAGASPYPVPQGGQVYTIPGDANGSQFMPGLDSNGSVILVPIQPNANTNTNPTAKPSPTPKGTTTAPVNTQPQPSPIPKLEKIITDDCCYNGKCN